MRSFSVVCLWLCVAACGRIGFGETRDGGGDATNLDGVTTPDALGCTPFDIYVPSDVSQTSLAWTGDHYVLWMSKGNAFGFVSIANDGTYGGFNELFQNTGGASLSNGNTVAFGSGTVGVLWANAAGTVQTEFLNEAYMTIVPPDTVGLSNAAEPYIAWADDRFVVVYRDTTGALGIVELDATGTVITNLYLPVASLQDIFGVTATSSSYLISANDATSAPIVLSVPRPLAVGDVVTVEPLTIGTTVFSNLEVGSVDTNFYAVQAPVLGAGGLQPIDATGAAAGAVVPLPLFGIQPFNYVTLGSIGGHLRVMGLANNEYVGVDFDPVAGSFGMLFDLGVSPGGVSTFPSTTSAPGRFAITMTGGFSSGNAARVIQQCE